MLRSKGLEDSGRQAQKHEVQKLLDHILIGEEVHVGPEYSFSGNNQLTQGLRRIE